MSGQLPAQEAQSDGAGFWPHAGAVLFFALIFFINFASRIVLAPLLPTIEKDLGLSHSQAGFLFFLISLGYMTGLAGSGFLSSRLTHRGTIIISCAFVGIALFSVSAVTSLWAIRVGLLGLGLAAGLYLPSGIAAITALVDSRHWGKAVAIHELAPNLAFLIAPLLAEIFLRWSSWHAALGLMGGTALVVGLAFARYGKGGDFYGESPASAAFGTLLGQSSFWLMLILFGLAVSSTVGVFAMLPLYLVTERRMAQSWVNTLIALSRLATPLMSFVAGWASDRLGPGRTMAGSLFLTGAATLLLGPAPGSWTVACVLLQAALSVCFFPAGFAALSAIGSPRSRNVAVSLAVPSGFLIGAGAMPTFIGYTGDAGSFASGFTVVGGFILAGAALAVCMKLPPTR